MVDFRVFLWTSKSGRKYKYDIYKIGELFNSTPGNFIFAREIALNKWNPIYIGETSNLQELFEMRKEWQCITRYLATHIHVHESDSNQEKRSLEVSDLLTSYKTACNV
jgi:hypothetical protein